MSNFLQVVEPCITSQDNVNMAPVSDSEMEYDVLGIWPLKAPSPDGLQAVFYQTCWKNTKNKIKDLVNDFLINNVPLQDVNHTYIALIPKVNSPETIQHKTTLGRYLGIHNIIFWKDPANANLLIERIRSKFASWKANTLSKAGRLTLIKASVSGIPNHTLSCFKCPREVCKELNVCCRRFFWGNDKKVPPVSWKDVCLPKHLGGLRVRSATLFNKAALAKLGWICLTDTTNWWAHIMTKKYSKRDYFLFGRKKTSQSLSWKAILDAPSVLLKGCRWIVGNGQSIPFWTTNWVFPFPLLDLIPEFLRHNLNLNARVANFIQNHAWQRDKLLQVIDEDILDQILSIPLPLSALHDKMSPHIRELLC
ncbi:unnamed protein product [Prunus armeniaca]